MKVKVKKGMLAFVVRILQAKPVDMSEHAIVFNLGIDRELFDDIVEVNRWPDKYRAQVLNDWDSDEAPVYDTYFIAELAKVRLETKVIGHAFEKRWKELHA